MPHLVGEYNRKFDARPPKNKMAANAYWNTWNKKARAYGHEGNGDPGILSAIASKLFVSREESRPAKPTPAGELSWWRKALLAIASPVRYFSAETQRSIEDGGGGVIGSIGKTIMISLAGILLILLIGTFLFFSVKKAAS